MKQVVYFATCGAVVKIGTTSDLRTRLPAIATARGEGRWELIGAIYGAELVERAIQAEFISFRIEGEWFSADSLMLAAINELISKRHGLFGEDAYTLTDPQLTSGQSVPLNEAYFVARAAKHAEILFLDAQRRGFSASTALEIAANAAGVSAGLIWGLKYRLPKTVTAGQSDSLMRAADGLAGEASGDDNEARGK